MPLPPEEQAIIDEWYRQQDELKRRKGSVLNQSDIDGDYSNKTKKYTLRRHRIATMYVIGASMGQLAKLEQVRQPTIVKLLDKALPNRKHIARRPITLTELSYWNNKWIESQGQIQSLSPERAAAWLVESKPSEAPPDNAYTTLPEGPNVSYKKFANEG